MEDQLVKKAENFVKDLLTKGLTADHRYHDLPHTLSVRDASLRLGRSYQLSEDELEILEMAALFHDTGFTKIYAGHEEVSKEIAASFLKKGQWPDEKNALVLEAIDATKLGVEPLTMLQKIIKDADFNTLDVGYLEKSDALRHEWKVFCQIEMSDEDWLENNYQFWSSHVFYTGEGQALFGEEKRQVLKKLKKKMEKKGGKSKAPEPTTGAGLEFDINSSKSAQMMFKTTLRNHVDLTNIADNKANIMLSINSLLITLSITLIAGNLEKFPLLVYPAVALLTTCILSIVFATLATRPVKMQGQTDIEKIGKSTTNLFFFGNFYKMNMADYRAGLKKVVRDEVILDDTIVTDLFFLGKALGQKFMRLRTCYSIFMIGMITTVLAFAVVMIFQK